MATARFAVAGVAAVVVTIGLAPAAAANGVGAVPSEYRSVVLATPEGVTAEVLAADDYLAVHAAEGVAVDVPGYDGEPYLRFEPDGTVWRNVLAPATHLNEERYATEGVIEGLADVDADAEPEWEHVGDAGTFAWHDHRIHWMSPETPPQVADATEPTHMFEWEVPVTVDGEAAAITGELVWFPSVNPAPWLVGLAALAAAGSWVGIRRAPLPAAAGGAAAAAVLGTALVVAEVPERVTGMGLPAAASALPLAIGGVVVTVAAPSRPRLAALAAVVAALAGGLAAGLRLPVLWRPVMPGPLDALLARPVVTITLAAAVTGVVAAVAAYPKPRGRRDEPGSGSDAEAPGSAPDAETPGPGDG